MSDLLSTYLLIFVMVVAMLVYWRLVVFLLVALVAAFALFLLVEAVQLVNGIPVAMASRGGVADGTAFDLRSAA
jgi:hypothetical protein